MSVNEKTHAEIIDWMRKSSTGPQELADMLAAAHKREIDEAERRANHAAMKNVSETLAKVGPLYDAESIGNAAKLREACANIAEYARSAMCHTTDAHVLGYLNQIEGWAKAALAEPVKNCEVGTAEEQAERFSAYCRAHKHPESECLPCPLFGQTGGYCELAWAQMPYEEGGAK